MNLQSITKNEDFVPIFIQTTEKYYSEVLEKPISIIETKREATKCLYINFVPSFISSFPITQGMKECLYCEYNVRGSKLKYLAGKLLVFFTLFSRGAFSWKKLWINSLAENSELNFFCLPCNRTNRYFDFAQDWVDCVTKCGYGTGMMKNQLIFRQKYQYPFVPQVIAQGDYWYREKIMHGNALARVTNQERYSVAKEKAIRCLGQLVQDTKKLCSPKEYISMLNDQIDSIFCISENKMSESEKQSVRQIINTLENWLKEFPMDIPVSMSHGDFQEGNIWVNRDDSVVIYDWETNGYRSVWYDLITLMMRIRNTIGTDELGDFVYTSDDYLLFDDRKSYSHKERETILRIISTEDFLFRLSEYSQMLFNKNEFLLKEMILKYRSIVGG